MAELHRVEINEKVESEIAPEDQPQAPEENRPEWLPEKFKSAEDMAQAYSELEKKMGAGANVGDVEDNNEGETTDEQTTQEEETEGQNDKAESSNSNKVIVDASKEFFENDGQLSEETYKKLEEAGLPKDLVDSYAEGQRALLASEESQIQGEAQGQWDEMADWANDNLPPEEIDAFDEAVTNGTVQQAKLAVQGLYARFQNATGSQPRLIQGAVKGSSTMPFKSMQELARAQSDPRYKSGDKAYHEEVDRRLAISSL